MTLPSPDHTRLDPRLAALADAPAFRDTLGERRRRRELRPE
ncbi:MAG TPA: hypothetical protein VIK91_06440 [Nannocystis sp.]